MTDVIVEGVVDWIWGEVALLLEVGFFFLNLLKRLTIKTAPRTAPRCMKTKKLTIGSIYFGV